MQTIKLPKDSFFENQKNILDFGKPSRDIAIKNLKNMRSVIDIGAHVGISVIQWAGMFENVYAFEPMKDHYDCLLENTKDFNNIEYFNCALSNTTTVRNAAYRTNKNSGSFQLLDDNYQQPSKKAPREIYKIETKTLDSFNFKNIDLIKIDVEGWEYEVLLGAKNTIIENHPILIVEFTGGNSSKSLHTYNVDDYFNFIKEIGYVPVGTYDDDIIYVKG